MTRYLQIETFPSEFSALVEAKASFTYERTSYTKKIKADGYNMIFNPEGQSDFKSLALVNRVRNDAKAYMERHNVSVVDGEIYFTDLFSIPRPEEIISKVDLTSAYWKQALLDGIVKQETNEFMLTEFSDYSAKKMKGVRLRALGSLATRKEIEIYEEGVAVAWEIQEQPTKQLYMGICRNIDQLMRKCRTEVDGCVFYYWDCMFVKQGFSQQVIDFFLSKDFECKSEETRLVYEKVGTKGYLLSEVDGKMYLVASENRNLLKQI